MPDPDLLYEHDTGEMLLLHPDELEPDPDQPRKHFNEAAIKELAKNLQSTGLQSPIAARRKDGNGKYRIIWGERRWRAALLAKLTIIPVIVKSVTNTEAFEAQVAENLPIYRVDLDPMDRARAIKRLITLHGTQEKVAERMGRTQGWVANEIAILDIPEHVKKLCDDNIVKDKTTLIALSKVHKENPEAAKELIEAAVHAGTLDRKAVSAKLKQVKGKGAAINVQDTPDNTPTAARSPQEAEHGGNITQQDVNVENVAGNKSQLAETQAVKVVVKQAEKVKRVTKMLGLSEHVSMEELLERLMDEVLAAKAS